jgi:hypothetical protein
MLWLMALVGAFLGGVVAGRQLLLRQQHIAQIEEMRRMGLLPRDDIPPGEPVPQWILDAAPEAPPATRE